MTEWTLSKAQDLYALPFADLMYNAQTIHRKHFNPNAVQIATLLSIKTGGCPENCAYCPQSAHYSTGVEKEPLMKVSDVVEAAKKAKELGSTRFCLGAAWRGPRDREVAAVCEMVKAVKDLGMETCVTLGLLKEHQAVELKNAGLDFYNHNVDTSPEYYEKIISTRSLEDRLQTIQYVRKSGIKVCCGGIVGMGETVDDRLSMLLLLKNLEEPPESVPINMLIKIPGTPLEASQNIDPFDFVRMIAMARILLPTSYVRLSAGRQSMSEELHSLCFLAGANSIHYGEKLLTTDNPEPANDRMLLKKLGMNTVI